MLTETQNTQPKSEKKDLAALQMHLLNKQQYGCLICYEQLSNIVYNLRILDNINR